MYLQFFPQALGSLYYSCLSSVFDVIKKKKQGYSIVLVVTGYNKRLDEKVIGGIVYVTLFDGQCIK